MADAGVIEMTKVMLANSLGCSADEAYLLLRFGEGRGWIKPCGNLPSPGGRGRGLTVYAVPIDFGERLKEIWEKRTPTGGEG